MGYHIAEIKKGKFGDISKLQEELDELKDCEDQQNKIMALVELSDLYGAIKGYLVKHIPSMTMEDLRIMSEATERAFKDGTRIPRN